MGKSRLSRRGFGTSAVAAALGAIAQPGSGEPFEDPPASSEKREQQPDLTPAQREEVEARFNETIRRYGDRLSDEQRTRIRRVLIQNQRMLSPIRDFSVHNGDTPATTLKLRVAESFGPGTHVRATEE